MMYYFKLVYGYMLEFSLGLEERYQKFKKQNKVFMMGNGKVLNDVFYYRIFFSLFSEGGFNLVVYLIIFFIFFIVVLFLYYFLQMINREILFFYCSDKFFRDLLLVEEFLGVFKYKDFIFEFVNFKIFVFIFLFSVIQLVKLGGIIVGYEIQ